MATERIVEYYKGFQVVAAFYNEEYQARGHHKFVDRLEARKCTDIDEALTKIKKLILILNAF